LLALHAFRVTSVVAEFSVSDQKLLHRFGRGVHSSPASRSEGCVLKLPRAARCPSAAPSS